MVYNDNINVLFDILTDKYYKSVNEYAIYTK